MIHDARPHCIITHSMFRMFISLTTPIIAIDSISTHLTISCMHAM